jgi:hypothetical protein
MTLAVRYLSQDIYQVLYRSANGKISSVKWDSKQGLLTAISLLGIQQNRKAIKALDTLLIAATKNPFIVHVGRL